MLLPNPLATPTGAAEMTARGLIKQAELFRHVTEWLKMGYAVTISGDEVKVMPKEHAVGKDEFASVKLGK